MVKMQDKLKVHIEILLELEQLSMKEDNSNCLEL